MLESSNKHDEKLVKYSFIIFIYVFLCVFFYIKPLGAGLDDIHYSYVVNNQGSNSDFNPYGWSYGFMLLIDIASKFDGVQFSILSLFVFSISYFCYSFSFSKLCPIVSIPLLWYFSHYFFYKDFTQFRSAIAYSIVLVGFYFLYREKIKTFILFVILACFFHISSLVALSAYFAVKLGRQKLFFLIFASIILASTNIITDFFQIIFKFFLNSDAYKAYVLDSNGFAKSIGILHPTTLKYLAITFLFYFMSDRLSVIKTFNFVFCLYMIAPIWIILFSSFGTLAGRPASIFSVLEGCLLAHLVCYYRNNSIIIRLAVIFLSLALLIINLFFIKPINTAYFLS